MAKLLFIKFLRLLYDLSPHLIGPKKQNKLKIKDVQLDEGLKLRIYSPLKAKKLPLIIFYHGGGWVIGSIKAYDRLMRYISYFSQSIIVAVEYRKAPEHKYPAAMHDAISACKWVLENIKKIGGDKKRVGLMGDSAGGNIAAHLAEQVNFKFKALILIYPLVDVGIKTMLQIKMKKEWLLKYGYQVLKFCLRHYLNNNDEARFISLPKPRVKKIFIITAETDVFTPSINNYAQSANAQVTLKHYAKTVHGFLNFAGVSKSGRQALQDIVGYIKLM